MSDRSDGAGGRGPARTNWSRSVAVLTAALMLLGGACFGSDEPPQALRPAVPLNPDDIVLAASLERFDACAEVVDYVADAVAEVGPGVLFGPQMEGGFVAGRVRSSAGMAETAGMAASAAGDDAATAAPAAPAPVAGVDYSDTNVQEEGVDEPDVVKTDGDTIFAVARQRLQIVDAATVSVIASLPLGENAQHQLLRAGDRLLVIGSGWRAVAVPQRSSGSEMVHPGGEQVTTLTSVDVSDPGNPRVVATRELEGTLVSARMVGSTARLVVTSYPQLAIETAAGVSPDEAARRAIAEADSDDLIANPDLVSCDAVHHPTEFSGVGQVTVFTVDAATGAEPKDAVSVVADAQTVYASAESLYVATTKYVAETAGTTTELHKFDISSADVTRYVASGQVRGHLLNQWSLSEHQGVLRVATTDVGEPAATSCAPNADCVREGETESFVSALEQDGEALVQVGQVGGLGRGERIYAVRYLGDIGFVVTFRQTDPLYTLDLSNPREPKVLGELKILGYSAYLHPIGDDLLLGVGQDATEEGRVLGTQVSVFDVSDLADPKRIHQASLAGAHSNAEFDHRAFLWWASENLAVIPVQVWSPQPEPLVDRPGGGGTVSAESPVPGSAFLGAVAFRADRGEGLSEHGRVTHSARGAEEWAGQIERSLVVDGRLFTLSQAGLLANRLADLADAGFAGFGG